MTGYLYIFYRHPDLFLPPPVLEANISPLFWMVAGVFPPFVPIKVSKASLSIYLYNDYIGIPRYCLLHKMLKKTKIITITTCIVNRTYTISYLIGVRPVLISINHHSRAALDNRKGGGVPIASFSQSPFLSLFSHYILNLPCFSDFFPSLSPPPFSFAFSFFPFSTQNYPQKPYLLLVN